MKSKLVGSVSKRKRYTMGRSVSTKKDTAVQHGEDACVCLHPRDRPLTIIL